MTDKKMPPETDPVVKQEIDRLHDAPVAGENHDHTDDNPAVISATEARGGGPDSTNFSINWISILLAVVGLLVVLFLFLR